MSTRSPYVTESVMAMLIKEVKKRNCIWDADHEDYNDRYHTAVAWKEISTVLELPEDLVRTKWKSLRDMFKREQKKSNVKSINDYQGKWRHFRSMFFIVKQDESRATDEDNNSHDSDGQDHYVKFEAPEFTEVEFLEDAEDPIESKRRKTSASDDNYDLMFLKSLTPYFSQLDPIRKLVVRNKMQDMLLNEIAAQQSSSNLSSSFKKSYL